MQSKLQELTQKIYQEGLEKGNAEAKAIVEKAKTEAKSIVEDAKKEALKIVGEAQQKASETALNTNSEIKLASRQAFNALKQQITDTINSEAVNRVVSKTFDTSFTKNIVEIAIKNYSKSQSSNLVVLLPAEQEKELADYFKKSVKEILDQGLEIKFDSKVKSGFVIAPKDGSYKLSFTDQDFNNFFKQYLRPKITEILFQD